MQFLPEARSNPARLVQLSILGISALGSQAIARAQTPAPQAAANACSIEVNVTDMAGTAISSAHVAVTQLPDQHTFLTGTTGDKGMFSARIPSGEYAFSVESPGFATYRKGAMVLNCHKEPNVRFDVQLQIGMMGEVVLVSQAANPFKKAWRNTASFFRRVLHSS
jgi:hypothetical protein